MSRAIAQPTRALLINSQRLSVAGRHSRNGRRAASIARDSLVARCCGWPRMRSSCGHVRGGGCAGEFPARAGRTAQPSLNPRIYPYFSPARRTAMAERSPLPAIGGGQPFGAIAPPCEPEQAVDGPIHKYADGLPLWHTARGLTF
jgi:hypothetical protein